MEKQDARSLPPAAQEALRHRDVQAILRGQSQTAVAITFGLSRGAVAKWMQLYRQNGEKALNGAKRCRHKQIQLEPCKRHKPSALLPTIARIKSSCLGFSGPATR